ncbi:MAG: uroporphyrinogen decarboxylase, partial [Clostridia bacterium]|nr:uroporphyrinogen decarboxylase [Clostridia bacterium]
FTLFERAWSLRGMENLLMDMIEEPQRVDALLDAICEYDLRVLDIALSYEWDGFHFGDDWGQQRGLIMGPHLWRRFIKPRMARLYARVKEKGLWVSQHSCGDLRDILDDLAEIGLNVYNTVQPEIYDLAALKRDYQGRLAFWGGISTQRDLSRGSPAEIAQITRQTLRLMARGGGYIAAPTHAVEFDVPPENLLAMEREFEQFSWNE